MISVQKNDIFYCYAQEDKLLRDEQEKHLSELKRKFQLTTSRDRIIQPGEAWSEIIDLHLYTANLIFWLISPDFMESGYYSGKEIRRALLRHRPNVTAQVCSPQELMRKPGWNALLLRVSPH